MFDVLALGAWWTLVVFFWYFKIFLVFTHVMKRPCWCTKQWENVAHVLHNNRIKFPKDFLAIVLYTNMAAVTSHENRELKQRVVLHRHLFCDDTITKIFLP